MWRDVDTYTLGRETRGTYSRSPLPSELEFLAADRILSRESRDARAIYATSWASRCASALYIHNVIHQNVVMRLIVYRRPSEFPKTYPETNGERERFIRTAAMHYNRHGHHSADDTGSEGVSIISLNRHPSRGYNLIECVNHILLHVGNLLLQKITRQTSFDYLSLTEGFKGASLTNLDKAALKSWIVNYSLKLATLSSEHNLLKIVHSIALLLQVDFD